MKKLSLTIVAALCALASFGQNRVCGTMQHHNYLLQTRPNYAAELAQYNQMIQQYMNTPQPQNRTATNITIPVVLHVVYNTAAQNITDAQAISQLSVLNNDFQKLNSDTGSVPTMFKSRAGGVSFTFCLAQRDPNGNATTGVVHKSTTLTSFSTDDKVKFTAQGGDDAWDVTKYMNIWICPLASPLLGYGEFPTTSLSNTYGLVINYTAAGTSGTAQAPYNKGRTGTHEFGHCFNLLHIWGDDNGACTGDDQCADTPNQKDMNYGTPTFPQGTSASGGCCNSSDVSSMYMNYMDYVDDAAMFMFTQNQCTRMLAVVTSPPWNVLQSSNGCTPLTAFGLDNSVLSIMNPLANTSTCNNSVTPKIVMANTGTVTLTSATVNYKMDAGTTQVYNWTGSLAPNATATITLNAYTGLTAAQHVFSVSVTSPNGGTDQNSSNNSQTSTFTVTAAPTTVGLPFTEGFESTTFVPTGWQKISTNTLNAANTWTRVVNSTGIPVTPASTAIAKMDNYSGSSIDITGQRDALRSPALSFASANSSLKLKFDVAYRRYDTSTADSLNVWISTDCGGTWTNLYNKGGATLQTVSTPTTAAFTPTSNAQWRRDSISLSAYAGQPNVYIKFENVSNWGNNLYLDNINISNTSTVQPAPAASFSTAATSVCANSPMQLTDQSTNSPTSWAWSATSSTGVSFSNATAQNPTVTFANAGTYTVSLVATNSGGSGTYTKTITVNALPNVTVNSPTICAGQTTTLTAAGASTYSWSTGASGTSLTQSPANTTNYTVTGTSTAGCVKTATATVTVKATPTVSVNTPSICTGSSAVLTASGATTYSWSTSATTASISVSPANTATYTVTGTTNGCTQAKTATVTVNSLPTVSVASSTICSGQTATLTASGTSSSYTWNTGASGANLSVSPSGTTSYTVTGTSSAGCAKTATASVTVKTTPSVNANSTAICQGSSAVLTASGATSYNWSTSATTSTISVSPSSTATYTVTGTTNGCSGSATAVVTVNSLPSVNANASTICAGGTATLTASGASTYTWSTGANGSSITVSPSGAASYTVTGTNASGCTASYVTNVNVASAPSISVNSATICNGGNATLNASGVSTYSWSTGSNNTSVSVSPSSTTVYTVTGNSSGCSVMASNTATVIVNPLPSVALASIPGSLCDNSPAVTLNGTPAGGTYSGAGVSGNTFSPGLAGIGTFTLSYAYTDANSCSGSDSKSIVVTTCTGVEEMGAASISVYPNPVHDLLYIQFGSQAHYQLEIYDATGRLVYSAEASQDTMTVGVSSFAKGLYTLRIKAGNKQTVSRFIKD